MIQPTSAPSTFGTGGPKINAGNFRNRGYEISVDANYAIGRDFDCMDLSDFLMVKLFLPNGIIPMNPFPLQYN